MKNLVRIQVCILLLVSSTISSFCQSETIENDTVCLDKADRANFLSLRAGAKIHSCSSTDSTKWQVQNIIDSSKRKKGTWRTKSNAKFPHWVIIELPKVTELTTFSFNTKSIHENNCPRGIIIELSTESGTSGFRKVAHEFLKKNKDEQIFSINADTAKWIKISIFNNYGSSSATEIGRVYAYNDFVINQYEMVLEMGQKLDLHNILFESNSAVIKEESIPIIELIAHILQRNPNWNLIVEGHTDKIGDEIYNKTLSEKRAKNVVKLIEEHGIDENRLQFEGLGSSMPLVDEETEDAYAQNRRVTLRLSEN